LRRHAQARRYTLRIHAATREIVLTMPPRGSVKQANEFAQKHGAWIATRLRRLPQAAPFAHGTVVPLRGIGHRIDHRRDARGTVWIECGDDGAQLLCVAGDAPHVARRIRDFLKREAKRDLEIASRQAAQALGVSVRRVSVRDQASRWGSCSSTGALSYSWRLILAPPFVLEYLAAHEVAHLVEMNHSRRFWRLVERICPHTSRAKNWLRTHGTDLHRYGADAGSS
jgi:predicted metal-dependent hydrolase